MNEFALYIHWPYCLSKCPYCDFASIKLCDNEEELQKGYQRDILNAPSGRVTSIYFGGGTPSLMSARMMNFLMNQIHKKWQVDSHIEITVEANPDAINKEKMHFFASQGVNRLSMGVQSLNDKNLRFLGRLHSVETALQRIDEASETFSSVNIDLMYGLPHQSLKSWEEELEKAISLKLPHYSLYQLTIESGTLFYKRQQKTCSDIQARKLYILTDELMNTSKVPAYEVSNYAKRGFECKHNMAYWLGKDYIGIGPSACGRVLGYATQNDRSVGGWLNHLTQQEKLTSEQIHMEHLLMGLRLRKHFYPVKGLKVSAIQKAKQLGWLIQNSEGICPTQKGILMLNQLILMLA